MLFFSKEGNKKESPIVFSSPNEGNKKEKKTLKLKRTFLNEEMESKGENKSYSIRELGILWIELRGSIYSA